jgi:hypothetical protein
LSLSQHPCQHCPRVNSHSHVHGRVGLLLHVSVSRRNGLSYIVYWYQWLLLMPEGTYIFISGTPIISTYWNRGSKYLLQHRTKLRSFQRDLSQDTSLCQEENPDNISGTR